MQAKTGFTRLNRIVTVGVLAMLMAGVALASPSNKWRITVDGDAKNAGTIVLSMTPEGGTESTVTVAVADNLHENSVARLIRDATKAKLGKAYKVETDDGESVLVKKKGSSPNIDIVVVSNDVEGISIKLHHE